MAQAIAKRHNLRVVEDAAQSFGSTWKGRRIGSFGDFVSFSFHPNKNVTSIALELPASCLKGSGNGARESGIWVLENFMGAPPAALMRRTARRGRRGSAPGPADR